MLPGCVPSRLELSCGGFVSRGSQQSHSGLSMTSQDWRKSHLHPARSEEQHVTAPTIQRQGWEMRFQRTKLRRDLRYYPYLQHTLHPPHIQHQEKGVTNKYPIRVIMISKILIQSQMDYMREEGY